MFLDVSAQFALTDRVQKGADLLFLAGGQKLDSPILQVPNGTGDIESFCYLPD